MYDSRAGAEKIQDEPRVYLLKVRKAKEEKWGHVKIPWLPMAKAETTRARKQTIIVFNYNTQK